MIRSDWYMVCCVASSTEDCQPQSQFVSSCSDLISSTVQRVVVMTQGLSVIVLNIGALTVQLRHGSRSEKYLIVTLTIADLLMGLYLIGIASVDLHYRAVFYNIVSEWTTGVPCITLSLLNFVSSEVSLIILCILSVARMISIKKVGGMTRIKSKIKKLCFGIWVLMLCVGILVAVYLLTHKMRLHNTLCILLGVSNQRYVTDLEYMFQMMLISCNLMFLIVIIISMACIFHTVAKSNRSIREVDGDTVSSLDVLLARVGLRLLLLLVCNVLSWLPFLIVSALLVSGISVHENILQWVAVLVLPICACSDPTLYNISSIKRLMMNR